MDIIKRLESVYIDLRKIEKDFFEGKIDFKVFKSKRLDITKDIYYSKEYKSLIRKKVEIVREINRDRLRQLELYDEFIDIVYTFGYKETLMDVFAVGDYEVSEKYDKHLPKQLRYSWGMYQIYAPIHGYDKIGGKIVKSNPNAWVDMSIIRKPDIGYQVAIFTKMFMNLADSIKEKDKLKRLYLIAMRYNGSGELAIKYANNWISIYKNKEYKGWL